MPVGASEASWALSWPAPLASLMTDRPSSAAAFSTAPETRSASTVGASVETHSTSPRTPRRQPVSATAALELVASLLEPRLLLAPELDPEQRVLGHDVRRARFDHHPARRADAALAPEALHGKDGLGRRAGGVVAQVHRHRARMVAPALEVHDRTVDAGDRRDHADLDPFLLEAGALLDVALHEGGDVARVQRADSAR